MFVPIQYEGRTIYLNLDQVETIDIGQAVIQVEMASGDRLYYNLDNADAIRDAVKPPTLTLIDAFAPVKTDELPATPDEKATPATK